MEFSVNHPILYIMVGILITVVLSQSVYFLIKALKRAKSLGIDNSKIKKTITTSAIFTIAPAVAILVGVIALSKSLGVAIPWLRLSIIGSLSYEIVASKNAMNALGISSGTQIADASDFITILWVMTLSIAAGLILVPLVTKKIQGGMNKIGMKDKKWSEVLNNAMFLGMISAFLGYVFCNVDRLWKADENGLVKVVQKVEDAGVVSTIETYVSSTSGLIPIVVMAVSAIVMAVCGVLSMKVKKCKWLTDYALPISLIAGMAAAIPVTNWLG